MFENYKKYNVSLVEVIIERLIQIYDVGLISEDFKYVQDDSFETIYLEYIVPGNNKIERLISVFDILEDEEYLLIPLPIESSELSNQTKESTFNDFLDNLNSNIKEEILNDKDYFLGQMQNKGLNYDRPLLFKNKEDLKKFFQKTNDNLEHYFISNLLLFPKNMKWMMLFDYDLYAIHFSYNKKYFKCSDFKDFENFIHSDNDIQQLIEQAKD